MLNGPLIMETESADPEDQKQRSAAFLRNALSRSTLLYATAWHTKAASMQPGIS